MQLVEITDQTIWDNFVSTSPFGHPLQLWAWGEVKKKNGWEPLRLGVQVGDHLEVAIQILFWNIPKTKMKLARCRSFWARISRRGTAPMTWLCSLTMATISSAGFILFHHQAHGNQENIKTHG